jgi:uncharacterized protein YabE (DUF348 family)
MRKSITRIKRSVRKHHRRVRQMPKHPFVIPVVTFLVMFIISGIAFVMFGSQTVQPSDSHSIILYHDKKTQTLPTRAGTVKEFMDRASITVNQGDVVEPSLDTPIVDNNFHINIYRAQPVTVVDSGHKVATLTAAVEARTVAGDAGVKLYPEDQIKTVAADQAIKDGVVGQEMVVDRATPITLNLYGSQLDVRTHAKTVGDLLKEKQVTVAADDTISPAVSTPLTANTQVYVSRNGMQIVTSEEAIPAPVQYVEDANLSFGSTAVRQVGTPGKRVVTYQVAMQNGREVGRTKIQEVITVQPVAQITARGKAYSIPSDKAAIMSLAGISQSDYPYVDYIISRESGWCATKWQGEHTCPAYYEPLYSTSAGIGYGLCQSTPAGKMASAGSDWQANAVTQLKWCSGYATRYGGWAGAYDHWVSTHWW